MRWLALLWLLVASCGRSHPPPLSSSHLVAPGPDAPLPSPGVARVEGASATFERAIRIAEGRNRLGAMVELWKVVLGETGEADAVREVAAYNLGTLCLELGFYTHAVYYYSLLAQNAGTSPDVLALVATGLGVISERLGETTLPLAATLARIPEAEVDRAAALIRPQLRRLRQRGDTIGTAADLSRVAHELELLRATPAAFQTTGIAAEMLQELVIHQSLLEAECARQNCTLTKWQARALPTPVQPRTITPRPQ
jgi:hypothetical protein